MLTAAPPASAQLRTIRLPVLAFAAGRYDLTGGGFAAAFVAPDARAGFFVDLGVGIYGEIGGGTPWGATNGFTARLLAGWAF